MSSTLAKRLPPTVTIQNGIKEIRSPDGRLHSSDGPAVEHSDGSYEWYSFGVLHREGGPALKYSLELSEKEFDSKGVAGMIPGYFGLEDINFKEAFSGILSDPREGLSAPIKESWRLDGILHREDGPAQIFHNKAAEWWEGGELVAAQYPEELVKDFYLAYIKKYFSIDNFDDYLEKRKESLRASSSMERSAYDIFPLPLSSSFSRGEIQGEWQMLVPEIRLYDDPVVGREDYGKKPEIIWHREIWHYDHGQIVYKKDYRGVETYYKDNVFHREGGPAVIHPNGRKAYYTKGVLHRESGPAIESPAIESWYANGERHREDGPANITSLYKEYYQHDKLHRTDGPAIVNTSGTEEWYKDGKRHREDGPALTRPEGFREEGAIYVLEEWYKNGALHREGGPAQVWSNGRKVYYKNGKKTRDVPAKD